VSFAIVWRETARIIVCGAFTWSAAGYTFAVTTVRLAVVQVRSGRRGLRMASLVEAFAGRAYSSGSGATHQWIRDHVITAQRREVNQPCAMVMTTR